MTAEAGSGDRMEFASEGGAGGQPSAAADCTAMWWALVRAAHIGPCLAVTAIATALAVAAGRGPGSAWVSAAVLAGQFSVGWGNDWLDAERDRAAGRADKPVVAGEIDESLLARAAALALTVCAALSLTSGARAAAVHLVAVALGWAYNLGLKRTPASVLPYAGAFALLPVFVALGLPGHPLPPAWLIGAAGLLGAAVHFPNALPDLAADAVTGVRGLPQRLGARRSLVAASVLLAAAGLAVVAGPTAPPGAAVLVAVGVGLAAAVGMVWTALRGRPRAAFRLSMGAAGAFTAAFVASGARLG